ncbi:hypothetical protein, partial [Pseudomonas aeruginosa]|uniref:hypothetical protein n=1 Tax=Pseudomonas aeruginosa TaxID=287 RepID=UPI001C957CEA
MKKVFLCAILASLSYPAIASSLQDQLSAVAEAEQQGKNEEQRSPYSKHQTHTKRHMLYIISLSCPRPRIYLYLLTFTTRCTSYVLL